MDSMEEKLHDANKNITKQYAVSYALLIYNELHPNDDSELFGRKMVEIMRKIKGKRAVRLANELLTNSEE